MPLGIHTECIDGRYISFNCFQRIRELDDVCFCDFEIYYENEEVIMPHYFDNFFQSEIRV